MIVVIDNYDSFVENLARYVRELGHETQVVRNDKMSVADIEQLNPSHIILSPGPCAPNQAGICLAIVEHFTGKKPILGVCLGHQVIAQAFGANITKAQQPMHGKTSKITHQQQGIFLGIETPLTVARYHSLIAENMPVCLKITAYSAEGEVMALAHRDYPIFGVQFHPESFLTDAGYTLLQNFINV